MKPYFYRSIFLCFLLIWLIPNTVCGQNTILFDRAKIDFQSTDAWVDSVYLQLSPDERIAQLFWVAIEVIQDTKRFNSSLKLIEDYHPGGILFMKTKAESLVRFNTAARKVSRVPLIVAIDGEWGLNMRINGITPLPKAMTMGAVQDFEMHFKYGQEVARQFKTAGIHVNLAPVSDVNSNPENPIIGNRSYGENPILVAQKSVAYMLGMQDGGIMAVAKHFPGHGDTDVDSHLALPVVKQDRIRLDSVELVPFRALVKNGIMGVMTAHIEVPALDSIQGMPASLSHKIVTELLQNEMGFSGLVITDAMNMKGAKINREIGRVDALALIAGNDVVESTENLPKAIIEVKKAIDNGELSWADIERKCRKVLTYKKLLVVNNDSAIASSNLISQINRGIDTDFIQSLYNQSICRVWNDSSYVDLDTSLNCVMFKLGQFDTSNQIISADKGIEIFRISTAAGFPLIEKQKAAGRIIIGVNQSGEALKLWNHPTFQTALARLRVTTNLTVVYTGSPYYFKQFENAESASEVIFGFESNNYTYQALKKVLNNEFIPTGKLPVTINEYWKEGAGGR
jgi:beta-N-acetylhexosaminidase